MKKVTSKKNIQTVSKASNKRKNGKPPRKNKSYTSRKTGGGMVGNAPIAVSDDLQQYVRFSAGGRDGRLCVDACIPLYQINSNYHDGTNLIKGGLSLSPTNSFPYAALTAVGGFYGGGGSDVDKDYISPIFNFLGSTFVRYRTSRCEFIYEPQSTTTVADRLVFAFANDPEHPKIKSTPAAASQSNFLALQDSVAFAPWRAWSLDVSQIVNPNGEYYTYNQDSTTELDNRFLAFGAIGCLASVEPSSTTAMTIYGILYARIKFEYYELCPIASSTSLLKQAKALAPVNCGDQNCKKCMRKCIHEKDTTCTNSVHKNF